MEPYEFTDMIYSEFVRDLRYDKSIPTIRYPRDYNNQEIVKFVCSQHDYFISDYEQRKITNEWCDFLNNNDLPIKEVQFCTKVNQKVFDAVCSQSNIESLRFKWLACKDISKIRNLTNLKKLFIELGSSIEDISPIGSLENLETLILGSTKKINDYSSLKSLKNLNVFSICSYQIRNDVMHMKSDEFISHFKSLEYLYLNDVIIDEQKYVSNENLKHLKYFEFRNNKLNIE